MKKYTDLIQNAQVSVVEDLQIAYQQSSPIHTTTLSPTDKLQAWLAASGGVSLATFEAIRRLTPFTDAEWAGFFEISTKSLHRYRQDAAHVFKLSHSEVILQIAECCTMGLRVFGSAEAFERWLHAPTAALAGKKPFELLGSVYGHELLLDELHRIDQGLFA